MQKRLFSLEGILLRLRAIRHFSDVKHKAPGWRDCRRTFRLPKIVLTGTSTLLTHMDTCTENFNVCTKRTMYCTVDKVNKICIIYIAQVLVIYISLIFFDMYLPTESGE